MNDFEDNLFELELKRAEDKYHILQKHLVEQDLLEEEIPLLWMHMTKVLEEIVEIKTILGIYYAN